MLAATVQSYSPRRPGAWDLCTLGAELSREVRVLRYQRKSL